jgi:signal transduction histidine kinase
MVSKWGYLQESDATVAELRERLRVADEALQRTERLAVANRYAAAIMHEINNPLESLTNLMFLIKHNAGDVNNVMAYAELSELQLVRMGELTRRTLSFYRDHTEPTDFDLIEIVESALKIHSHRLKRQSVEVCKKNPATAIANVFPGEILQVLSNLVLNSLDALPETGGVLTLRIKIYGGKVHILIADNGTGMETSIYENLFKPHLTTKPKGNGLGLWLSRDIVQRHRGAILCRSSRRQGRSGTMFKVSLPLRQTDEASSDSGTLHLVQG